MTAGVCTSGILDDMSIILYSGTMGRSMKPESRALCTSTASLQGVGGMLSVTTSFSGCRSWTKLMWENIPRTTIVFPGCSDWSLAMAGVFRTSISGSSTNIVSSGRERISLCDVCRKRPSPGSLWSFTTA